MEVYLVKNCAVPPLYALYRVQVCVTLHLKLVCQAGLVNIRARSRDPQGPGCHLQPKGRNGKIKRRKGGIPKGGKYGGKEKGNRKEGRGKAGNREGRNKERNEEVDTHFS